VAVERYYTAGTSNCQIAAKAKCICRLRSNVADGYSQLPVDLLTIM
jgi:hypothetical protein